MKNSYSIFGQGFVGTNFVKFLRKKKYKVFIPKKGKYKFNKNLQNVIYCIGEDFSPNDSYTKNHERYFAANLGIVPKIIFNNKFKSFTLLSTTRVYLGNPSKKTNEDDLIYVNTNITNFLFNSLKLAAENLCLSLPNKKIRVARMSNLFGNNFTDQTYLLPTLIRNSVDKKKINILINKKSSKDFLHVNEAIDILLKIIKNGKYRLYNIASGKNIELFKIAKKINEITKCKINYRNQNKLIKEPIIDISRVKKEFNFKPKKNLIKSLDQIIINYKKKL